MCTVLAKIWLQYRTVQTLGWRNVRVAINFASMLNNVATWDAKKLGLGNGDIEMKTHKM